MALLQISEPGLSAAPHQRRLAVGIDLGTTNSWLRPHAAARPKRWQTMKVATCCRQWFTISSRVILSVTMPAPMLRWIRQTPSVR